MGSACVPCSELSASMSETSTSVSSRSQPTLPNTVLMRLGECSRQPFSSRKLPARNKSALSLCVPYSSSADFLPQEPPDNATDAPGYWKPDLVDTDSDAPRVFKPNTGLDPGISVIVEIAFCGIRSQFTTSPNGSLTRTPSTNTDNPCGVPSNGEAVRPRKLTSGWNGLFCPWLSVT